MEWFRINASFPQHPKHGRLAKALGITRQQAGWIVLRLFCWVAQTCDDGNLDGVEPEDLAEVCGWSGEAEELIRSLLACKWIDKDPLRVHEWREYQAPVFANREKSKAWREKQKNSTVANQYRTSSVPPTDSTEQTVTTPLPPSRGNQGESRRPEPGSFRIRGLTEAQLDKYLADERSVLSNDPCDKAAQDGVDRAREEMRRREVLRGKNDRS